MVRKVPGEGFGAPEVVGGPYRDAPTGVQARVGANGETFVLWHAPETARAPRRNTADVMVAVAPPGGPFGPATRLAEVPRLSQSSLAVADDGHALVSLSDGASVLVSERAPGDAFGTPAAIAPLHDPVGARTSAALGAGGQATVGWSGMALGGIDVVTRAGPGAFSAALRLAAPDRTMRFDIFMANAALSQLPGIWRFGGGDVEATLTAGTALVSWSGPHGVRRAAHLATVPLAGGAPLVETVGGAFADPERVRQVRLADGAPALTWTDITRSDEIRVWLAADGAERPEPAALPRVSVGHLSRFREARVRCSAACEVRLAAVGKPASDVRLRLERAGSGTLDFDSYGDSVRLGPKVRLRVTYGAPDGTRTRSMLLTRRVRGYRPWPNVRAVGLRAVRKGDAIRVSWRLDGPQPTYLTFYATGSPTRDRATEPVVDERARNRGDARSFAVTLRPATGVRYVTLYSFGLRQFKQVVRVR